jgi:hypothetical protein
MNNKYLLILLVALLVLTGVLYFLKGSPDEGGFDLADRSFKIENTDEVESVSIERKNYPVIIFNKQGDNWYLNNGRMARPEGIQNIFAIMKKLRIKYIPNKSAAVKIHESIEKDGIKVNFFGKNDKFIKSFLLGPDLGDGTSTAFLMKGSKQPYAMEALGFTGSIRTRFVFDMNEYETKDIFATPAENIKEVTVKYPKDKPASFTIKKSLTGTEFFNPYTNTKLPKFNEALVEPYLTNFQKIIAEYNDAGNPYRDTISASIPFAEVTLKDAKGDYRIATFYNLRNIEFGEENFSPRDEIYDDTRFSVATNKKEFFLVQYRVIKKLFTSFERFERK